jgi:hypothetical protein
MIEVVIGSVTILTVLCCSYLLLKNQHRLLGAISSESDMIGENLNHVAGAIVGLSELLEEADQVIEEAARIPTMGEMMQQMLVGFISQKMQPMLENSDNPIVKTINQATSDANTWQRKEDEENLKDVQNLKQPST